MVIDDPATLMNQVRYQPIRQKIIERGLSGRNRAVRTQGSVEEMKTSQRAMEDVAMTLNG
jgi:hypothetical protein